MSRLWPKLQSLYLWTVSPWRLCPPLKLCRTGHAAEREVVRMNICLTLFVNLKVFFFSLIEFRCDVSDMWVQLLQVGRIRLLLTIQRLLVRLQVHQTSLPSSKLQRLKKEKSTTSSLKQYVCWLTSVTKTDVCSNHRLHVLFPLHQGDPFWVLCTLWEKNQVWQGLSSLPGLSAGDSSRMSWAKPDAVQSHSNQHSHQ